MIRPTLYCETLLRVRGRPKPSPFCILTFERSGFSRRPKDFLCPVSLLRPMGVGDVCVFLARGRMILALESPSVPVNGLSQSVRRMINLSSPRRRSAPTPCGFDYSNVIPTGLYRPRLGWDPARYQEE